MAKPTIGKRQQATFVEAAQEFSDRILEEWFSDFGEFEPVYTAVNREKEFVIWIRQAVYFEVTNEDKWYLTDEATEELNHYFEFLYKSTQQDYYRQSLEEMPNGIYLHSYEEKSQKMEMVTWQGNPYLRRLVTFYFMASQNKADL